MPWDQCFFDPIMLPDRKPLITLREAALYISLPPGNYTAVVRGVNQTTGVGLVEVYNLP